jgi:molybdopterin converting factor small subunit
MTAMVHIHLVHRQHTDGNKTVEVKGDTVGRALADLIRQYPELEKPVAPGDDIQIITFLAGG